MTNTLKNYKIIAIIMLLATLVNPITPLVQTTDLQKLYHHIQCRVHLLAYNKETGKGSVVEAEISISRREPGIAFQVEANLNRVSEDTLESFKLAALYASILLNIPPTAYSYSLRVNMEVEGLSATLGFFVALLTMLKTGSCQPEHTGTGLLIPGGVIGPVGKLHEKLNAAVESGIELVYIPKLQLNQLEQVPRFVKGVYTVLEVYEEVAGASIEPARIDPLILHTYHSYFEDSYIYMLNNTTSLLEILEKANWIDEHTNSSLELLAQAENAYNTGRYYVAASLAYGAFLNALASYLRYLARYEPSNFKTTVKNLLGRTSEIIDRVHDKIHELAKYVYYTSLRNGIRTTTLDINLLDTLINVYTRAIEAAYYLNTLNTSNYTLTSDEIASLTVQAYARAETAVMWLDTFEKLVTSRKGTSTIDNLPDLPLDLLVFADVNIKYLEYVLETPVGFINLTSGMSGLEILINKLANMLFEASMVYRELASGSSSNFTLEEIDSLRELVLKLIAILYEESGTIPAYPVLLLELVDAYLRMGSPRNVEMYLYIAFTYVLTYLYLHRVLTLYAGKFNELAISATPGDLMRLSLLVLVVLIASGLTLVILSLRKTRMTPFLQSQRVF